MFRFLLFLGLGYFIIRLFRGPSSNLDDAGRKNSRGESRATGAQGEKMVKCASCGLYVPEPEALAGGWRHSDRYFCSQECQKNFQA